MKRPILRALAIALLLGFTACTTSKDEPDEETRANDEKIQQMETELGVFRERIRNADADRGLRDQLMEDEALLKSRLERARERSKQLRQTPSP
jgi:hypothetical protein